MYICKLTWIAIKRFLDEDEEEEFGVLEQGEFFGEVALLKKDKRTANVVAMHPGAECLTLDREYEQFIIIIYRRNVNAVLKKTHTWISLHTIVKYRSMYIG